MLCLNRRAAEHYKLAGLSCDRAGSWRGSSRPVPCAAGSPGAALFCSTLCGDHVLLHSPSGHMMVSSSPLLISGDLLAVIISVAQGHKTQPELWIDALSFIENCLLDVGPVTLHPCISSMRCLSRRQIACTQDRRHHAEVWSHYCHISSISSIRTYRRYL